MQAQECRDNYIQSEIRAGQFSPACFFELFYGRINGSSSIIKKDTISYIFTKMTEVTLEKGADMAMVLNVEPEIQFISAIAKMQDTEMTDRLSERTGEPKREEDRLLEEISRLIGEGISAVQAAADQDLILILGGTGCGKSTAVNYLAGCQMVARENEETGMEYIECLNPVTEIGNGAISQTLYPNVVDFVVPFENSRVKLCDTAGFSDNRGVAHDICASISLGEVFTKSASIYGVIILIQEADVLDARLTNVLELFRQINRCLHRENFRGSLKFYISKSFLGRSEQQIFNIMQRKYMQLQENRDASIEEIAWIFEELLEANGKNIRLCQPLNENGRIPFLRELMELNRVQNKAEAFEYPISAEARLQVVKMTRILANELNSLADAYIRASRTAWERETKQRKTLEQVGETEQALTKLNTRLKELEDNKNDSMEEFIRQLEISGYLLPKEEKAEQIREELRVKQAVMESLVRYVSQDCELPKLSEAAYDTVYQMIQGCMANLNTRKNELLSEELERIFCLYEIQKLMQTLAVKQKYMELSQKREYLYTQSDFAVCEEKLPLQEKEKLGRCLKELLQSENGNRKIADAVSHCLVNPYTITETERKGKKVITIKANIADLTMGRIVLDLRQRNLEQVDTMCFYAKNTIYMDENLGMELASGRNIIMACRDLDVFSNVKINVSGQNGGGTDMTKYGANGQNGKSAGNITLLVDGSILRYPLTLVANGGNGSDGTNGIAGQAGTPGEDGKDGGYTSYFGGAIDKGIFEEGTKGTSGGAGSDGGNAGAGGKGGKKGTILVLDGTGQPSEALKEKCRITSADGTNGRNGLPGAGGLGGPGGKNGYNTLSYSMSGVDKTWHITGYFTSWKSECSGFKYHLELYGGGYWEGKGGEYRTYAGRGARGRNGSINQENADTQTIINPFTAADILQAYKLTAQ